MRLGASEAQMNTPNCQRSLRHKLAKRQRLLRESLDEGIFKAAISKTPRQPDGSWSKEDAIQAIKREIDSLPPFEQMLLLAPLGNKEEEEGGMKMDVVIEIQTKDGPKTRQAKRVGLLAIHKENGMFGSSLFTITHIPTGYAVFKGPTEDIALRVAERLQVLDWNFTDPTESQKIAPQANKIVRELRAEN
jgi:hypothetical protein